MPAGFYRFDGTDDEMYHDAAPVTAVPFSMGCRFRVFAGGDGGLVWIGDKDSQLVWWALHVGDPGVGVSARVRMTGAEHQLPVSTGVTVEGQWHTALAVYAADNDRRIYLDGGNKGTDTTSVTPVGADRIAVGGNIDAVPGQFATADVVDVMIWNVALTDQDAVDYHAMLDPQSGSVVARYVLDQEYGTTVSDISGNGHDLTVVGALFVASPPKFIQPDFQRNPFPFMAGSTRRLSVARSTSPRESGGPAPMGAFERFLIPRLHPIYVAAVVTGESSLTLTAGAVTSGTRTRLAATTLSQTVAIATAGKVTHGGAASLAETVGVVTAGSRTRLGATTLTLAVAGTATGKLAARGAVTLTETVAVATAGTVGAGATTHFGAASLTATVSVASTSILSAKANTATALTASVATAAAPTLKAAASLTVSAASATVGKLTAKATSATTETVTVTTAATTVRFAAATLTLAIDRTTVGTRTQFGTASLTETVTVTTAGRVGATHTGTTALTLTVACATAGTLTGFGAVSRAQTLAVATAGTSARSGSASLTIAVATGTAGTSATSGVVSLPIMVTTTTSGTAPETHEEILAGWIATAVTGHEGLATTGQHRNHAPVTGHVSGGASGRTSTPRTGSVA